jgi:diacylglycerol kinase family enzyme
MPPKEDRRDRLADLFRDHGLEVAIGFAHRGPELVALARQSARHAGETVDAGGGDGTINAVASVLLGTYKVFGKLPLRALNDFTKVCRFPLRLNRRYKPTIDGRIIPVDGGDVNGHLFLNNRVLASIHTLSRSARHISRNDEARGSRSVSRRSESYIAIRG